MTGNFWRRSSPAVLIQRSYFWRRSLSQDLKQRTDATPMNIRYGLTQKTILKEGRHMTRIEVLKKLHGKRFYSETFGDMITIHDIVIMYDDGRTELINDEATLKELLKEADESGSK